MEPRGQHRQIESLRHDHAPQRSAAVTTGASQYFTMSASIFNSVIEVPAISRLVM